jgi:four helix bundle protein
LVEERDSVDRDELKARTKDFAHRCVKLALALPEKPLGRHARSQLIRCSTSVAANYRAVCVAQSRAAFVSKLSIVVEEADESCFWMEFIKDEGLIAADKIAPLLGESEELTSIFVAARRTTRANSK